MHPLRECLCLQRRQFLTSAGGGIGLLALHSLLQESGALAAQGQVAGVPQFTPTAKRCIFFHMEGAPSQFDLFSYKPKLNQLDGTKPPAEYLKGTRFAFSKADTALLMGNTRPFKQYGASGMWFSDLLPNLSKHADRICMLNAVGTSQFNHAPGQLMMETGHNLEGHPSVGSWLNYGLGSENQNLPGYVVLNSSLFLSAGQALWSSGFLPTTYSGVPFQATGNPILNLTRSAGTSAAVERRMLDTVARLNTEHKKAMMDPEIMSRIENYELAFRMQTEAPGVVDLSGESAATLDRYGVNRPDPPDVIDGSRRPPAGVYGAFARHCLLARRMVEKGVRFVNVYNGSWDMHAELGKDMPFYAGIVDQPIAALIQDLQDRGLLKDTLVVFASEFGRTPIGENRPGFASVTGRDHHPDAFSLFMVGGGIKGGVTFGETDDIGWRPIKDAVDVSDVHATILRLFGIDHTGLTYRHDGLDQRLTPVTRQSKVIDQVIA